MLPLLSAPDRKGTFYVGDNIAETRRRPALYLVFQPVGEKPAALGNGTFYVGIGTFYVGIGTFYVGKGTFYVEEKNHAETGKPCTASISGLFVSPAFLLIYYQ